MARHNTKLDLRAAIAREQRNVVVQTARRLTTYNETVRESDLAAAANRDIINQFPESAQDVNAVIAELQAYDRQIQSRFSAAPVPRAPTTAPVNSSTSSVRFTDVTDQTCMLPHCGDPREYTLPCRHAFCGDDLQDLVNSNDLRCPMCRAPFTEADMAPVTTAATPSSSAAGAPSSALVASSSAAGAPSRALVPSDMPRLFEVTAPTTTLVVRSAPSVSAAAPSTPAEPFVRVPPVGSVLFGSSSTPNVLPSTSLTQSVFRPVNAPLLPSSRSTFRSLNAAAAAARALPASTGSAAQAPSSPDPAVDAEVDALARAALSSPPTSMDTSP
jgi:hypothetical protein